MVGSSAILSVEGLRAPALLSSASSRCGSALNATSTSSNNAVPFRSTGVVRAQTQSGGTRRGRMLELIDRLAVELPDRETFSQHESVNRYAQCVRVIEFIEKVKVLQEGDKSGTVRDKASGGAAIKLLSRVEQMRLLSKAEKAGLLSAAENAGFSLSSIEKLGLLSKAEKFGALSAATDPNTPGSLLTLALALLAAGPVFVYFVPEDSTPLVVLQVLVALLSVVGGSAAFAASNFVSELQKSD